MSAPDEGRVAEIAARWEPIGVTEDPLFHALAAQRKMERAFQRDDDDAERRHEITRDSHASQARRDIAYLLAALRDATARLATERQHVAALEATVRHLRAERDVAWESAADANRERDHLRAELDTAARLLADAGTAPTGGG